MFVCVKKKCTKNTTTLKKIKKKTKLGENDGWELGFNDGSWVGVKDGVILGKSVGLAIGTSWGDIAFFIICWFYILFGLCRLYLNQILTFQLTNDTSTHIPCNPLSNTPK